MWRFYLPAAAILITTIVIQWQWSKSLEERLLAAETMVAIKDAQIQAKDDAEDAVTAFVNALQAQNAEMQALLSSLDEVEGGNEALDPYLRSGAKRLWP